MSYVADTHTTVSLPSQDLIDLSNRWISIDFKALAKAGAFLHKHDLI